MKKTVLQEVELNGMRGYLYTEDIPKLNSIEERIARWRRLFEVFELRKSTLPETRKVVDLLMDGKVVCRMIATVTNSGGKKDRRSVNVPAGGRDYQILKEEQKLSGIPFCFVAEDREYVTDKGERRALTSEHSMFISIRFSEIQRCEENGVPFSTRHFLTKSLNEAKDQGIIAKNRANNLVGIPASKLEEYIYDAVIFEMAEYA